MKQGYKQRTDRKFIGGYRPRIDGLEKASGKVKFADDITLKSNYPDMLYAKVLRSPYAHARIKNMDVSKAEKMLGFKAKVSLKEGLKRYFEWRKRKVFLKG